MFLKKEVFLHFYRRELCRIKTQKNVRFSILISITILTLSLLNSCMTETTPNESSMTFNDPHSFARPDQSKIKHLEWTARINFDQKKIFATAQYTIESAADASQLILDTKDLEILSVKNGNNETLNFELGDSQTHLGAPLTIQINKVTKNVTIEYITSPAAEAIQWLDSIQTADKKAPFLFTQSQAILARSWIPIQDSPGIRFTYNATVSVPKGLLALMSASNPTEKNVTGVYSFEMAQPIPAYLMALAVGDVQFASLGDRSGVYAEPSLLEKSAFEFEDLEQMIEAAEGLYGKYRWDQYDLIVLPPSFPFGGMENPRLTFATPTILAGDKSLTSLVAHELAHSWSGNLVTNATWNDFWLNEGFTVYFEYRIMEEVYGREYSEMLALLSLHGLKEEMTDMIAYGKKEDTSLKLDLAGRNPDDGMTAIAYDKGYFFLRLLEETFGRERFDSFLKDYFAQNAFKVMTTEEFLKILKTEMVEAYDIKLADEFFNEWIYQAGLPENCPIPQSDKFQNVANALESWLKDENEEVMVSSYGSDSWSTHEWLHFISLFPDSLSLQQMSNLDRAFGFTQSGNSEIFAAWAIHIIRSEYEAGYSRLEEFLIVTGRRKFLMPLYKEMIKTEGGKGMALSIYDKARPNYHFVSSSSIDGLMGL